MYQNMLVNITEYIDITATDEWRATQKFATEHRVIYTICKHQPWTSYTVLGI